MQRGISAMVSGQQADAAVDGPAPGEQGGDFPFAEVGDAQQVGFDDVGGGPDAALVQALGEVGTEAADSGRVDGDGAQFFFQAEVRGGRAASPRCV